MKLKEFLDIINFDMGGQTLDLRVGSSSKTGAEVYRPCAVLDRIKDLEIDRISAPQSDYFSIWFKDKEDGETTTETGDGTGTEDTEDEEGNSENTETQG